MEKYIIDDRLFSVKFSCDVEKCKGACCTLKGAGGAPVLNEEVKIIKRNLKIAEKYLSKEHIEIIEREGFLVGEKDDYSINSYDYKECVFVFYENGIAKCSFEKAYNNGETEFRKPISCHLFPVRIYGSKRKIMRYEELYECSDALDKGEAEDITVFEFAKDALEREYGKNFYNDLKEKYLRRK